jgi:hypothetical protein
VYVTFLERNDKTVVRVDQNYFKLNKVKTNVGKKKGSVSLLQIAKQETSNEKIERFSNYEIEQILDSYLQGK